MLNFVFEFTRAICIKDVCPNYDNTRINCSNYVLNQSEGIAKSSKNNKERKEHVRLELFW